MNTLKKLSDEDIGIILSALSEYPYKISAELIHRIQAQLQEKKK